MFYDIASLTRRDDIVFDSEKETADNEIYEKMLEQCKNVGEAVEFLRRYNVNGLKRHHIMIVDKSGASVIVEWGRDSLSVVKKDGHYQVMTNFNNTDPTLAGWYPCNRYSTAEKMLRNGDDISVEHFRYILKAVHNSGPEYPTVYSNIYDTKNDIIYVFKYHNFLEYIKIDVKKELEREHSYYLPSLFSRLRLLAPKQDENIDESSVNLVWEGNADRYELFVSTNPNFINCESTPVTSQHAQSHYQNNGIISSAILIYLPAVIIFFKRKTLILIGFIFFLFQWPNCTSVNNSMPLEKVTYTVTDLEKYTVYYWKIEAYKNNTGYYSESITFNFKTR